MDFFHYLIIGGGMTAAAAALGTFNKMDSVLGLIHFGRTPKEADLPPDEPVDVLYNRGADALERGEYKAAAGGSGGTAQKRSRPH